MYERLLQLAIKDKKKEPLTDLSEADYLCDYYKKQHDNQNYTQSLLYMATT